MRSSTFIAVLGAGLAIASPIVRKALVVEVVTDVVYEYTTQTIPASKAPVTKVSPNVKVQCSLILFLVHFLLFSFFTRAYLCHVKLSSLFTVH
jgi:hypothetical protein